MTKIVIDKDLIGQAIEAINAAVDSWGQAEIPTTRIYAVEDALRAALEQLSTQTGVGNSGFDHTIAANFMSGREINDENVRKFVMASRWAHDDRASLQALVATLRQDVAARDAEIALLKQSLLDAEALAEPAVGPDRYVWEEYGRYSHGWGWSENTTPYDPRSAEKKQYHSRTDFNNPEQVRNFRALYTSPPPPAEPAVEPVGKWSSVHFDDLARVTDIRGNTIATLYAKEADEIVKAHNACHAIAPAEPAVEPVAWRAKDANGRWMYGDPPAPELPADAPQLLFASPPPPTEVPLLTDEEVASEMHRALSSMSYSSEQAFMDGVRAGEKAVRQKAGLK